jgi:hypothetical protein
VELYLRSPIRLHGVVISLKNHRDNFTLPYLYYNGSLGNRVGRCGLDASVSEQAPVAGCYEHGNEPWDFIKGEAFLD